jgi:hypothetical protein
MKIKLICCSMITGLFLLSSAAFANMNMSVDDMVNKMTTNLNLTPAQVIAVRPVIQNFKDKMDQIVQEKEQKLSGILSADQMNKMQSMKKDRNNK